MPTPIRHAPATIEVPNAPDVWYGSKLRLWTCGAACTAGCTVVVVGDALHDGGVAGLQDRGVFPDLLVEDVPVPVTWSHVPALALWLSFVSSRAADPRLRR
jgi:hypothetical protein